MRARTWLGILMAGFAGLSLTSCATTGADTRQLAHSYSAYLKGLLNDRTGDVAEAVGYYQRSKKLDQAVPALHVQLGLDYIRLKEFPKAAAEFERVVRLDPDDAYARYVLALLYIQTHDYKKAAGQYERLLEKNLNDRDLNTELRRILSQLYFLDGDLDAASKQCVALLQLDPLDRFGLYFRAVIASEKGETDKAIEGFREILQHYPKDADTMNALAYIYAEQDHQLDSALTLAEEAVAYDPANAAFLDTLGWIYFKMGQTDKAIPLLEKASRLTLDPVILNHLAEAYYKKGRIREAKERWSSSLILDPTQKDVRKRLKRD